MSVNNFDILKRMSAENKRIMLGLDVLGAKKTRAGTVVEIGIGGDWIGQIASGKVRAVLLMWDQDEYEATRLAIAGEESRAEEPVCSSCGGTRLQSSGHGYRPCHCSPYTLERDRVEVPLMPRDWKHTEHCLTGVSADKCICWPPESRAEEPER